MGYDFMVSNSAGALPHRATFIREANERLSWLLTHYAPGGPQWTGDEEEKNLGAVKAAGIKSKVGNREHLQEYGLSRDAYCRMMEGLGMDTPLPDVSHQKRRPSCKSARGTGTRVTRRGTNTGAQRGWAICMFTEPNGIQNGL